MGKVTLSLSDEAEENLRKLAKKNMRSMTKQVEFLLKKESERGGNSE